MTYLLSHTEAQGLDYSVVQKGVRSDITETFRKHCAHARKLGWEETSYTLEENGDMFFYYKRNGKTVILAIVEDCSRARFLAPESFRD